MYQPTAAKLLVAVSLAFGTVLSQAPLHAVQAAGDTEARLDTAKQAIERSRALSLVPAEASASAKQSNQSWEVAFWGQEFSIADRKPVLSGSVTLRAKDGKATAYAASLRSKRIRSSGGKPSMIRSSPSWSILFIRNTS